MTTERCRSERARLGPTRGAAFLREASEPSVVRRALRTALVVGSVLIAINQGDAIFAGVLGMREWAKMGLTVLVPYLVSTFSSVAARRELGPGGGSA